MDTTDVTPETLVNGFLNNNKQIYIAIAGDDFDYESEDGDDDYILLLNYYPQENEDIKNISNILNRYNTDFPDGAFDIYVCNDQSLITTYLAESFQKNFVKKYFCRYETFLSHISTLNNIHLGVIKKETFYIVELKAA